MAKTYITIGSEYKDAFDSICLLHENGCIDKSIVDSVDPRHTRIETGEYVFTYDGSSAYIRTEEEIGMTKEGATWFKAFRGGEVNNDMAAWHNFIESVARDYHKSYSLFEFTYERGEMSESELRRHTATAERFMSVFYPDMHAVSVTPLSGEDAVEDIYALNMRVSLSAGTGESKPVLAKAFFRKSGSRLVSVSSGEAEKMDDFLDEIVAGKSSGGEVKTDGAMIDDALTALENLLESDDAFTRCIMIDEQSDCEAVNAMVKSGPNEHVTLECTEVKPLGISHLHWSNNSFIIANEGKPVFKMIVSVDGKITVDCTSCAGERLVESGMVRVISKSSDGVESVREIELDASKENFGLSKKEIADILKNSVIALHYTPVTCGEAKRRTGSACTRYVCRDNAVNLGTEQAPDYRCKDCPYPEVIYAYPDGRRALTKNLAFAFDKMEMVDKAETFVCDCCGQSFTLSSRQEGKGLAGKKLCAFCAAALRKSLNGESTATDEESATYRRYAQMLPVGIRLKTKPSRKICYEREDVILFVMGEKRFIVKKYDMEKTGMLKSPTVSD